MLRAGLPARAALAVTFAADTVSITVMEVVDNAVVLVVPGAMVAGLATGLFWGSLALSLAVAFVLTVPVNRWLIARGRGHTVVHGIRPLQVPRRADARPRRSARRGTSTRCTACTRPGTSTRCTARADGMPGHPLRYPVGVTRFELLP